MKPLVIIVALWSALALSGCPDATEGIGPPPVVPDIPTLPDSIAPIDQWSRHTVASGPVGRHIRAATMTDGSASFVYFSTEGVEGELCTEVGEPGQEPPPKVFWDLHFAWESGGVWNTEVAQSIIYVGGPPGLDYRVSPAGVPSVATMIGEPAELFKWCGANDTGLLQRSGPGAWDVITAAAESGDAPSTLRGSDFGTVVGVWPGLTFDPAGSPVIVYKDSHGGGGLQTDDWRKADLELAWADSPAGGSWNHFQVDENKGAGNFGQVVFDSTGRPITMHHNPTSNAANNEHGLWASRSPDGGQTWERVQINIGENRERPSMIVHPDTNSLWIVYYRVSDKLPEVARNVDPDNWTDLTNGWEIERFGDSQYNEGAHPSIALAPDGRVGVAYYRCGRSVDTTCDTDDDAVIFAWWEDGEWTREVVDEGDEGNCGMNPALSFKPDGSPFIAYQCAVRVGGTSDFQFEVRVATREPLP